jgi:D-alanine-D-alanine ligase
MKICVLFSSYEQSDSPFKEHDCPFDLCTHLPDHQVEIIGIHKASAFSQILNLVKQNYDMFINLCDGSFDEDRAGIEVVQALEYFGVPFTGAAADFYDPSREQMKTVCHYYGIRTPLHRFAKTRTQIDEATASLSFPMIAKHPNSYASIGMTKASRVDNLEDLHIEAQRLIEQYGEVLIEEFIEGREFTVLVAENADDPSNPVCYQALEYLFPEGETFKHYHLKWIDYNGMSCVICNDKELNDHLGALSASLFLGLNGSGYGRCDIRMDANGELFLLEINPNCSVFYLPEHAGGADFILLNTVNGYQHFINTLFKAAGNRSKKHLKSWQLQLDKQSNYGLYASEDIQAGCLIEAFEQKPHNLVSRTYVEQHWGEHEKDWFRRYAYPLTDELWVMWSANPKDWKPINHCCDPSAWLQGLDVVARRPIARGEQITLDYATFCNEVMTAFECHCGVADCRKLVKGTDFLEPFMEQYADHLSDYVKTRRQQLTKL